MLKPPSLTERLIRLIYPVKCMVCEKILKEDSILSLCDTCYELLPRYAKGFVKMPELPYVDKLLAAYYYDEGMDSAIHSMKFNNQPKLAQTFAYLIYEEMMKASCQPDIDMVLPIPMHLKKKRKRGYNQSELLAIELSALLRIEMPKNLLTKVINTRPQVGLRREERLCNTEGAFDVTDETQVNGKNILLIDDVVTTGTTLNTCAKILYEKGASNIYACVIAIAGK